MQHYSIFKLFKHETLSSGSARGSRLRRLKATLRVLTDTHIVRPRSTSPADKPTPLSKPILQFTTDQVLLVSRRSAISLGHVSFATGQVCGPPVGIRRSAVGIEEGGLIRQLGRRGCPGWNFRENTAMTNRLRSAGFRVWIDTAS